MNVFEKIAAQQEGKEDTTVWMVGEQLKEICRSDPHCATIVDQDLDSKSMSLEEAEKKITEWSDKHRGSKRCFGVPCNVAEKIIREFYGLPESGAAPEPEKTSSDILDLSDLFS